MIKYLFLICLFFSCNKVQKNTHVFFKNNRSYDSLGNLLNGKLEDYYSNGKISNLRFYQNGILLGKWYQFGFDNEIIQEGNCVKDINFEDYLKKKHDIDYATLDIWKEGNTNFVSAYITLNKKEVITDTSLFNVYSEYLNVYKIPNKEILFLHNQDTIAIWHN